MRATNPEGTGGWSNSGRAATDSPPTEVPLTSGLVPAGLTTGDTFRLLFLTSNKRSFQPTQIRFYNSFVQDAAADGTADLQAHSSLFTAVASTSAVDARDNTGTRFDPDGADKGPPIYWLRGSKVADDYQDFYDGDWDDETNARDPERGSPRGGPE